MKSLPIIFLILAYASAAYSQNRPSAANKSCELTIKDAPNLRGLKLGMTESDINKLLGMKTAGNVTTETNRAQIKTVYLDFDDKAGYKKPAEFKSVETILLFSYESKLIKLLIKYSDDAVKFQDAKQFARLLSDNFKLPFPAWKYNERSTRGKLTCRDFQLEATVNNQVTLTDLAAAKKITESKTEKQKNPVPDKR